MVSREGNVLKVPGYGTVAQVSGDEILGSYARFTQKGLTLLGGSGVLEAGTLLKVSGTAKKYNGVANSSGISSTLGILRKGADTTNGDLLANYVRSGIIKLSALKYADGTSVASGDQAAVATALGGKIDPIHGYLIL